MEILFFDRLSFFLEPERFIQEKKRLLSRKIIEKRDIAQTLLPVLRRGIDRHFLQILHGSLAFHVKAPDRIDLISPEFEPDRELLRERKHVQDSPSHGKLSRPLDLALPLISEF